MVYFLSFFMCLQTFAERTSFCYLDLPLKYHTILIFNDLTILFEGAIVLLFIHSLIHSFLCQVPSFITQYFS